MSRIIGSIMGEMYEVRVGGEGDDGRLRYVVRGK